MLAFTHNNYTGAKKHKINHGTEFNYVGMIIMVPSLILQSTMNCPVHVNVMDALKDVCIVVKNEVIR